MEKLKPQERSSVDLVLENIGELLTISGQSAKPVVRPKKNSLGILYTPDLCIASSGGTISFIGRKSDLSNHFDVANALELDCKGKLALPGFVDSHTHAIFAGSREHELLIKLTGASYLEILRKGGGILKTVRQTNNASTAELKEQTRNRLDKMISYGTTTFEVKSGYALTLKGEIRLLEILRDLKQKQGYDIVSTLLSAHAVPEDYAGRNNAYIKDVVMPSIRECARKNLAVFCDVFMEEGVFGYDETERILASAAKGGMKLKIHVDEFSDQRGAELAAKMKIVSADHLAKSSQEGIAQLSRSGTVGVLLPGTQFSSFAGSFPIARRYIDSGLAVAIATDLSPNSWIESMQFVINLACYGMKMTPEEAIVGATINGAHAIGRASSVGSIEIGKNADMLVTDLTNYEELPYRIASNHVRTVIKNGKVIHENRDCS